MKQKAIILKKVCPYCKKEIKSLYQPQLEYNYQAHLLACKKKNDKKINNKN